MTERVRVGVVGCGLVAQVMHLPYLSELSDRFDLVAVCVLSRPLAERCAQRYGARRAHTRWQDLLDEQLDAALVLTSGDHAPIAVAAAERGVHVFAEKPMALSSLAGKRMIEAADQAGVRLMVGTMKRYDPAYERLRELLARVEDLRLVRVTTLEPPFAPYVAHYPLLLGEPTELRSADLTERCVAVNLRFGEADCHLSWVDLPGIARYKQEFAAA